MIKGNDMQNFADGMSEPQSPRSEAELDISDAVHESARSSCSGRTGEASYDEEMPAESPARVSLPDNATIAQAAAKTYDWAWKNRERIIEAGLNGLSPVIQGVGTATGHVQTYGAGVALGALDGLNQTATEINRAYQIYRHPEENHPQPNYLRAGNGVLNMAGAALYGASSAGVLNQYVGGVGAVVQGASLVVKQFLRKDTETYYPALPTHHDPSVHEVAALRTNSAQGEGRAARSSGSQSPVSHVDSQRPQALTSRPSSAVSRSR
nr:hypothetical protein [Kibdelosporangium sp. MJ126-NF4]